MSTRKLEPSKDIATAGQGAHWRHSSRGMTLIEVLLAMAILAVVLCAILTVTVNATVLTQANRQRSVAIMDATNVIGQARALAAQGQSVPDAIIVEIPEGQVALAQATLPGEVISVDYTDPSVAPLEITVTVQWRDLHGGTLREALSTIIDNG